MPDSTTADEIEMLAFHVGGEEYCLSLDRVEEVVTMDGSLTPLPNADRGVLGVMDLRGRTTRVLDPRVVFGAGGTTDGHPTGKYVVVLSGDGSGATGWLVDAVDRVMSATEDAIDTSVAAGPVRGVLKAENGFTVWVDSHPVT